MYTIRTPGTLLISERKTHQIPKGKFRENVNSVYTSDRIFLPRPYLFTVCDKNVTTETFIRLYNHKVEESISPFIGSPPPHLEQSGGVTGKIHPIIDAVNMESYHVDYGSKMLLRGQEVELGKSTHPLYWYQGDGNFNSSMGNDIR